MKFTASLRSILAISSVLLVVVGSTPRAEAHVAAGMTYDNAVTDALAVAGQRADLNVMRVSGQSMDPYFSDDAVVVVKKIDAARLRVGMIAVYLNRFGEKVAHRVMASVDGGWQVKGYSNDQPDSTVVNGGNLLGVVYATFHSAGRTSDAVVASSLPAVETVYAAPAK